MKSLRTTKGSYIAAFILGAVVALLFNWPAHAAVPPAPAMAVHESAR